jgi:hypothetical protein
MKNNSPLMHHLHTLFVHVMQSHRTTNFETLHDAANSWSPNHLREELSHVTNLSHHESEQLQRICLNYKQHHTPRTIFESEKMLYIYASNWSLLTTLPALCTFMMISMLGLNPFDAPELSALLAFVAAIPLMIIIYGKIVLHYNTLLNHYYLIKTTFIQKKTKE